MKRSDHELLLKKSFQRVARINSINMNDELFKIILHSLNEKKRMNFLKMLLLNISTIKKISICNEIFKRLNNDLINIFSRKFKFNCHKSFKVKIKSFRIIHEVLFKTAQLSHDFDSFINYNFLSIRLKYLKND